MKRKYILFHPAKKCDAFQITHLRLTPPQRVILRWGILTFTAGPGIFRIQSFVNLINYVTEVHI